MVYMCYLHNCEMNEVSFKEILNRIKNFRRDVFKAQTPDCFANPGGLRLMFGIFFHKLFAKSVNLNFF